MLFQVVVHGVQLRATALRDHIVAFRAFLIPVRVERIHTVSPEAVLAFAHIALGHNCLADLVVHGVQLRATKN